MLHHPMTIAIASGKGGTGKTTLAINLALADPLIAWLADCDVEAPNTELFLALSGEVQEPVSSRVPEIVAARCTACGRCTELCQFKGLVSFGTQPLVFADLCHGCGGCARVCPHDAIRWRSYTIGTIRSGQVARPGGEPAFQLVAGRLQVGRPVAPPLIAAVRKRLPTNGIGILDAPPGTACAMVATVRGCSYTVLVTEPTPFGLHDLKLAVAVMRQLEQPFGIVINRAEPDDRSVENWCAAEGLDLLGRIPFNRRLAEAYALGLPAVVALPETRPLFVELLARIEAACEPFAEVPHA